MTDEQTALARRAVACPKWRWMPGMRTTRGERVVGASCEYWGARLWVSLLGSDSAGGVFVRSFCDSSGSCLPDLTDPATLGCLLALVREAWGDPFLCPAADRETGWWLNGYAAVDYLQSYRSEAEALVAALESAP